MLGTIKILLEYMKKHKKEILWFKIVIFITLNIFLYSLLYTFLNEPMFWEKHSIKGSWLDILTSSILHNIVIEIPLNKLKIIILYGVIIIVNLSFLYLNTMLFAGTLIYFARTGYKIYTNHLINNENVTWMNLNFEYILTIDEKKQIFINELIKNNMKIDNNTMTNIIPILENLKTKNEILLYSKNYINEYLLTLKAISNESIGILEQATTWITPTTIIIGVIIIIGIIGIGYYINTVDNRTTELFNQQSTINKNVSARITHLDKNITMSQKETLNNLKNYNEDITGVQKSILKMNDNNIKAHEELSKVVNNHNLILENLTEQNKNIAKMFKGVAEEVANEPGKNNIIISAISNVTEYMNTITDKVGLLEAIINSLQEKINTMETNNSLRNLGRGAAILRNMRSPRNNTNNNLNENDET